MKSNRLSAKLQALWNAAAFIENHGEEGGIGDETFDFPYEMYRHECKMLYKRLIREADKLEGKYSKTPSAK